MVKDSSVMLSSLILKFNLNISLESLYNGLWAHTNSKILCHLHSAQQRIIS